MRRVMLPELWVTRRTKSYKSSDPSQEPTDSGGGTGDSGAEGDDENTDGDGDSGTAKGKEGKDGSEDRAELDRVKERMKAADKRAADAEAKLRELEDKGKSELELAQRRVKELEAQAQQLQEQVREKALHQALLTDSEFPASRWHDPEDVLMRAERALKVEDISIEEDGTVKGVGPWLKKLAKDKRHLLKPEDNEPEDDDERGSGASGGQFNGKSKDRKQKDTSALLKKYPALR